MIYKQNQSLTGYVRQNFIEIEEAISNGFRHEFLVLELEKKGYKVSIQSFRNALTLARKKTLAN